MIASGNGHTAFMRFLLDEGVDPGIASDSGRWQAWKSALSVLGIPRSITRLSLKKS